MTTHGSITLTEGTDYVISYSNNVYPGTATATLTGIGNFTDTKDVSFAISQKSLNGSGIDVSLLTTEYTYTGTPREPSVSVTRGGNALTLGTDYTVAYSNNVNAGIGTATIHGIGNYKGTVVRTFTIS